MTVPVARDLLFWCSIIDVGILVLWFLFFTFAHDFTYRVHGRWFSLSKENFDALHYALMGMFKLAVIMFNVVPYLVLRFVLS